MDLTKTFLMHHQRDVQTGTWSRSQFKHQLGVCRLDRTGKLIWQLDPHQRVNFDTGNG